MDNTISESHAIHSRVEILEISVESDPEAVEAVVCLSNRPNAKYHSHDRNSWWSMSGGGAVIEATGLMISTSPLTANGQWSSNLYLSYQFYHPNVNLKRALVLNASTLHP